MLYTGFHRKVNRVGKLVRRSLLILSLLVVVFAPAAAHAQANGNCRYGYNSFQSWSDDTGAAYVYHGCRP